MVMHDASTKRGSRRSVRFRVAGRGMPFCLVSLTLAFAAGGVAGEPAAPSSQAKVETLESLVAQLLDLELEEKKERNAWNEQKNHMDAMIQLLAVEKNRLNKALAEVENRKKEEESEQERIARRIAELKTILLKVAEAATASGKDLLCEYDRLPEPLQRGLKPGADVVKAEITGPASSSNAVRRLRAAAAFGHDLQRVLSEVHLVKQVIALGEKDHREADVLYLGGAVGFYLLPGGKEAGVMRRPDDAWTAVARDEIAPQVARAMAVKRKETSPALVRLPLAPESDKEESDE